MKLQLVAVFLTVCLLSLQGIRAAPNSGSFDGNNVGSGSFNNNGNDYAAEGNGGSFDGNNVGSSSFNNNGNDYAAEGNGGSFDDNTAGDNSFNNNGNNNGNPIVWY